MPSPGVRESTPPREQSHDAGPAPLQFRLKTLLFATTLAAALFAVLQRVSALWGAVLVWGALLAAAHVTANALGTHSTARSPTLARRRAREDHVPDAEEAAILSAAAVDPRRALVPTTRLGGNVRHGSVVSAVIVGGALVGSIVGTALIWRHNDYRLDWSSLILAACSSAVIGAFLTFLCSTCFNVAARAWHEAARQLPKPESRE